MKLRDYFAAPGVRILSVILGVLAGGGVALFKGAILGGLVGAVVVLFSSVFFPVWAYLKELPFNKMKKQLPQPLLLDERVDFVINGKRLYGFFVLTEDRMVMIAESDGKHRMELPREEVVRVVKEDNYSIKIYVNQQDFIQIQTPTFEKVYSVLAEKGWI